MSGRVDSPWRGTIKGMTDEQYGSDVRREMAQRLQVLAAAAMRSKPPSSPLEIVLSSFR
jgi:hypothetical protein